LIRYQHLDGVAVRLAGLDTMVARIALTIVSRVRELTVAERHLEREITRRVTMLASTLLLVVRVGALTAAKLVGEAADTTPFVSKDAFARHNGTAPLPVWSGNRQRHRLSQTGNRQLNAAVHRVAITQMRAHPAAHLSRARIVAPQIVPPPLRPIGRSRRANPPLHPPLRRILNPQMTARAALRRAHNPSPRRAFANLAASEEPDGCQDLAAPLAARS
jgi:hypothetical protein